MNHFPLIVAAAAAMACFFSMASYALRAFRMTHLEEAFGPRGRQRLAMFERNLKALRLSISLCRSLFNLSLAVLFVYQMGRDASGALSSTRTVLAAGIAAGIIAVASVAIPQAWANYAGEKFIAATLWLLLSVRWAMLPVTAVLMAFDLPIRRLAGAADRAGSVGEQARQEIIQAASEGHAEGLVGREEVKMIESVFDFGLTQAGRIMTPRTELLALPVETPWARACEQVCKSGHSRVPLYQRSLDNIVGIAYAKDLLAHASDSPPPGLQDVMRKPLFVPETKPLGELLREFRTGKIHIAVVLDEYGGTAGIITIDDLLEQLVGQISGEDALRPAAAIRRIDERTVEVEGRMRIVELNEALGAKLPLDAGYDTAAGLILYELGYIPSVGETLTSRGVQFTILQADERRIARIRVQILPKAESNEPV